MNIIRYGSKTIRSSSIINYHVFEIEKQNRNMTFEMPSGSTSFW